MITINSELCKACGICADVCPRHIPETLQRGGEKVTVISNDRIDLCMSCGHCQAVCAENAIVVNDLASEFFSPVEDCRIDKDQFLSLVKNRRSIRRYKKKPVPRELLDQVIEAVHHAPTGTARRATGIIILDKEETLKTFSEMVYGMYEGLEKSLGNPIARFVIRRRVGEEKLSTLKDFVMPGMHWYIKWYREGRSNEILRDCRAIMLFHSPVLEPMAAENCLVAAFHGVFMAQVLGLGSCFNDLIPPACNRVPKIREMLGLPSDHEVYASLTLGYPKYKFKQTIPRKLAEVRYLN